jgi:hypothetical protein
LSWAVKTLRERGKRSLMVFRHPVFIGYPELAGSVPGAWMQLAAGDEKLLEEIALRRVGSFVGRD